jgi:two-component system chemotaxis response regulator CheB
VRIVICAGSREFAQRLGRYLDADAELRTVAVFASLPALLAALAHERPDLVVMDLDLCGAGAGEATRRVMATVPTRVVLLAAHDRRNSPPALEARAAGALDVVPSSAFDLDAPTDAAATALRHRIKRLAGANRQRSPTEPTPAGRGAAAPRSSVIGICASTGGPPALAALLARLPPTFSIPTLVVQHMASGFIDGLVEWLDRELTLPVSVARAGEPLSAGIRFAPDGAHLLLDESRRLALDHASGEDHHRPSGDVLLTSLAQVAGAAAVAVVLTGMGTDGAAGLAAIAAAGGRTIAQDESSSAVYGMPRAAADAGAQTLLAPAAIGDALATLEPAAR